MLDVSSPLSAAATPIAVKPGGLADRLKRRVLDPAEATRRDLAAGKIDEATARLRLRDLDTLRDTELRGAADDDFADLAPFTAAPGLSDAVNAEAGRRRATPSSGTPASSSGTPASSSAPADLSSLLRQPTLDAGDASANAVRARAQKAKGRGAMLLTGTTGVDQAGSVAKRLLTGRPS